MKYIKWETLYALTEGSFENLSERVWEKAKELPLLQVEDVKRIATFPNHIIVTVNDDMYTIGFRVREDADIEITRTEKMVVEDYDTPEELLKSQVREYLSKPELANELVEMIKWIPRK